MTNETMALTKEALDACRAVANEHNDNLRIAKDKSYVRLADCYGETIAAAFETDYGWLAAYGWTPSGDIRAPYRASERPTGGGWMVIRRIHTVTPTNAPGAYFKSPAAALRHMIRLRNIPSW
jgi:hypothetical protein